MPPLLLAPLPSVTASVRADSPADSHGFPGLTALGPVSSERKARDWALVLQSMSVWHILRRVPAGWIVLVNDHDYPRAAASIDGYEAENRDWPPRRTKERVRATSAWAVPVLCAALLAFFVVTGPASGARDATWFRHGVAVTSQVLGGSPWLAVTALTLHADATHVLSNVVAGVVFGSAVERRLGPGAAAASIVASGALGNLGNALYHRGMGVDHASLGASTAVFGAIGVLASTEFVLHAMGGGRKRTLVEFIAPLVGGLALLGTLGAGSGSGDTKTDLGAHLFGFLAGLVLGLFAMLGVRRGGDAVAANGSVSRVVSLDRLAGSRWAQVVLGAVAVGTVLGSWGVAMHVALR